VPNAELGHLLAIAVAEIRPSVVCQNPFDPDTQASELGCGDFERSPGTDARLVGDRDHDGVAAGVVDHDFEVVVAAALTVGRSSPTVDPPAAAIGDPAELLVVLVDERAGMAGDVPHRRGGHPVGVAEAAEPVTSEDPMDRRGWASEERPQAVGPVPPAGPRREDLGLGEVAQAAR
jgi:hypothetical protein